MKIPYGKINYKAINGHMPLYSFAFLFWYIWYHHVIIDFTILFFFMDLPLPIFQRFGGSMIFYSMPRKFCDSIPTMYTVYIYIYILWTILYIIYFIILYYIISYNIILYHNISLYYIILYICVGIASKETCTLYGVWSSKQNEGFLIGFFCASIPGGPSTTNETLGPKLWG